MVYHAVENMKNAWPENPVMICIPLKKNCRLWTTSLVLDRVLNNVTVESIVHLTINIFLWIIYKLVCFLLNNTKEVEKLYASSLEIPWNKTLPYKVAELAFYMYPNGGAWLWSKLFYKHGKLSSNDPFCSFLILTSVYLIEKVIWFAYEDQNKHDPTGKRAHTQRLHIMKGIDVGFLVEDPSITLIM